MRSIAFIVPLLLIFSAFMVQEKKKVIFFGDSITQAGVQPGGYITRISDLATKEGVKDQFDFFGAGIGGNKIYDLYLRLEDDVLNKDPDIVVIYIGVNDVWHRQSFGTGTDLDKFEKFYAALISKIRARGSKVILATPAVIGEKTDHSNGLDSLLNDFSVSIRNLARNNQLPLVDLRKTFLEYNRKYNPSNKESGILTSDRVHLNEQGNKLVAEEMWKVIKSI